MDSAPRRSWLDRLSISNVTMRDLPVETQLSVTQGLGCRGFGVMQHILPPTLASGDLRKMLDDHGLIASACAPYPCFLLSHTAIENGRFRIHHDGYSRQRIDEIKRSFDWFAPLSPSTMTIMTGGSGVLSRSKAWNVVCEVFVELADHAASLGFKLALEPVRPEFAADFSIVTTIDEGRQLLEEIRRPNVGLMIETFHVAPLLELDAQLGRAAAHIVAAQLNDAMDHPRSIVDRLAPGEGEIDLAAIIGTIEATGFDGWYDIELPDANGRDQVALVEASVAGSLVAFSKAGNMANDKRAR
ncbi:MAG: sugar phosphate isomerase/epimerase [Gammaproteobacteria bacterium]|jgi:sugar phosphate isomerase/epimerase|nr:sugar phosphate isomerase/epimerase [Gammaproteobacteria bacterium]